VKAKVVFKIYLNTFRIATMQQFGMLVGEETQWLPCTAVVAALKAQGAWRGLDPGVQQLLASAYAFLWTPDLAIPRVCGRGIFWHVRKDLSFTPSVADFLHHYSLLTSVFSPLVVIQTLRLRCDG